MGYRFFTDADHGRLKQLIQAISYVKVGDMIISGVFQDPYRKEIKVTAHLYRIYDRNESPPERKSNVTFTEKANKGGIRGLVVCISEFPDTGFDGTTHQDNVGTVADPRAIWLTTRYTGGVRDAAANIVAKHQEAFHRDHYTIGKNGDRQPALSFQHIWDFILPSCEKSLSDNILEADIMYDQ